MADPYIGTRTVMRSFLDAVTPPGWQPVPGEDMDNQLSAIADGLQYVYDFLTTMGTMRDPQRTAYLDELEREYGVSPNTILTDAQRRAYLALIKYARNRRGTIDNMQTALNLAGLGVGGYGLNVYANDPPVHPGPFTQFSYQCVCGGANAYCGYNPVGGGGAVTAVCGVNGGLWVVNGDVFSSAPGYYGCGNTNMVCGYFPAGSATTAVCGYYTFLLYSPIMIASPTDAWTWPCTFFVAAGVTRAPGVRSPSPTGNMNTLWFSICSDPSGNIWATDFGGKIYKCNSGSTTFNVTTSATANWYSICSDPSGNIWATVSGGDIYKCPSGSTTFTGVGGTSRAWYSICSDPSGNIWATDFGGKIYKCNSGSTTFNVTTSATANWSSIRSDPSGNIWAAVYFGDIYKCTVSTTTFTGVGGTSRAWNSICSDPSGQYLGGGNYRRYL